jgi:hypothetical protein
MYRSARDHYPGADVKSCSAKRAARIILIAGLTPVIPCEALIVWRLGFVAHPHHVAFACIVAAIIAVFVVSPSCIFTDFA